MKTKSGWMILGIALCFGCDLVNEPKRSIQMPVVSKVDESLPKAVHPEYANWSRFPEKTFVVRKRLVSNSNGTVVVTTKMWLDKKNAEEVLVGSQVTVERPNEPIVENGEDIVRFPASYRVPKGMDEARFLMPSGKAKETGAEIITVGNHQFNSRIFEWEENNETGPMTVKLWQSDEIPGKIVRQELFTKSTETKSLEEVIEHNLPVQL